MNSEVTLPIDIYVTIETHQYRDVAPYSDKALQLHKNFHAIEDLIVQSVKNCVSASISVARPMMFSSQTGALILIEAFDDNLNDADVDSDTVYALIEPRLVKLGLDL